VGRFPWDDPRRVAAAEYTWLLAARPATNSPWRTLKARLRRHQVISTPPSTKPYQSCQYVLPPIGSPRAHQYWEVTGRPVAASTRTAACAADRCQGRSRDSCRGSDRWKESSASGLRRSGPGRC